MGSLVGHVLPGLAFFVLGLWHLFKHIKLFSLHPNSYLSSPWFPTSRLRYLELLLIIIGSSISVSAELFIGPAKHQPFDQDGTIPSYHLRNFEHSSISMSFIVYAAFAIVLDKFGPKAHFSLNLTQLLAAMAFGQQLLLFYLHSTDHQGIEGHYHFLLQVLVIVSLFTTLIGIGLPGSFLVGFVRSVSILFQGVWFMVMGFMIWTPEFTPKGCQLRSEDGHRVVRCGSEDALSRAKSLITLLFSWLVIAVTICTVTFYLALAQSYGKYVEYTYSAVANPKEVEVLQENSRSDVELQRKDGFIGDD
ncbi:hypothetical protein K2173_010908 [Erythroxylum novogranatense]|uniref:Uncharacterized protein n=1 Tax=Erythroxylum novogranatense TaxID=1862640 RepID=A0AAV8T070_9ROSI|nr:hypothetical protein K2173_010908 [Erythroxylum novogranatense]